MKKSVKKHAMTVLKITIAVLGLWWVLHRTPWHDQATIATGTRIRNVTLLKPVQLPVLSQTRTLVWLNFKNALLDAKLPEGKVVHGYATAGPFFFPPKLALPKTYLASFKGHAAIQVGLEDLFLRADPWLLLPALAILVIPFLITSYRWMKLLQPQGIGLPYVKCLELSFVGQFYSTFLPGTTSGDVVKIIYASRVTGATTKSAVTVVLDRVIGLVALMVVGGSAAAVQLLWNHFHPIRPNAAPDQTLVRIVVLISGSLAAMTIGCCIYFSQRLRRLSGLEYLLQHAHVPEVVKHADRSLHVYRGHFLMIFGTFCLSLISQTILPIAAFMAGRAFGMHASFGSFMTYVPIAVLAASLPIAPPQGIGVTEAILLHFFVTRGVDAASQSFALAQAIRFLPIFWNLMGAYWVVRGNYSRHAHTPSRDEAPDGIADGPAVAPAT